MLSDLATAWVRTVVPGLTAAALVALDAKLNLPGPVPDLGPWAVALVLAVLYLAVAWLERRWPKLGWLLGVPRRPTYPVPGPATVAGHTITGGTPAPWGPAHTGPTDPPWKASA